MGSKFTPEEFSSLIQANVWENICDERRKKKMNLNNNDDGDITARVNALGSTIEYLQVVFIQITDDHTYNGGVNNNGGNNNRGGKNNSGGNAQNGNCGGNNRSNMGNFGGSARRHGAFSYMTMDRLATTKVHDIHHVPNPTKPDTMART